MRTDVQDGRRCIDRQREVEVGQAKLIQTWGVDDAGHLVLTAKVESMTLVTPARKAVFDRQ
jgi:hypothetical protein